MYIQLVLKINFIEKKFVLDIHHLQLSFDSSATKPGQDILHTVFFAAGCSDEGHLCHFPFELPTDASSLVPRPYILSLLE